MASLVLGEDIEAAARPGVSAGGRGDARCRVFGVEGWQGLQLGGRLAWYGRAAVGAAHDGGFVAAEAAGEVARTSRGVARIGGGGE